MKFPIGKMIHVDDEKMAPGNSEPSMTNQMDDGTKYSDVGLNGNGALNGDAEKNVGEDTSPYPFLTVRTFIMTSLAAMGGFIFGYDTGQISGFLEMRVFLERFGQRSNSPQYASTNGYYFTNVRSGLIVGLLSIGTLIGALVSSPLSNKYGRKKCIPGWCIIFIIGMTAQIAVGPGQWVGIAMGRWVAGLGVGGLSMLVPLYMSESAPKQVRGACVCSYQLFITIGIFVADCINYGTEARPDTGSYRITMAVGYIWALLLGIGILFLSESPRWDIKNGFHDRAHVTMARYYGVSGNHRVVRRERIEINKALDAAAGDHPWYEAITGPRMTYRILLGMGLQMFQQLTGANYFFYYGTTIFKGVGIQNSYVTAMILGGVNFGSTFLGLYLVEKYGRRRCLITGGLWQFMCFVIFASIGHFKFEGATGQDAKTAGTVMIVFTCLFIVSFASTWGPMVWAAIGEMFPYRYRAVGMSLAVASNWFWNFMLAFFTPFITGDIDFLYGFVFAGCNLVAAGIVYFFLIESAGRTIEEVDFAYLSHVRPIKSTNWKLEDIGGGFDGTDNLYLKKGGKDLDKKRKLRESGDVGMDQVENVNSGIFQGQGSSSYQSPAGNPPRR